MRKQNKQSVQNSYTNNQLDAHKVSLIAGKLERSELKHYLKALKKEERGKNVYVATARLLAAGDQKALRDLFPEKNVIIQVDPRLVGGIRILNNDVVYEKNIAQLLSDMSLYLGN